MIEKKVTTVYVIDQSNLKGTITEAEAFELFNDLWEEFGDKIMGQEFEPTEPEQEELITDDEQQEDEIEG
jgi:hypothetical protein